MKIGLLSDSHTRTSLATESIEKLVSEGVEYLIHAGDVGTKQTLDDIRETALPYVSVIGNNDFHLIKLMDSYRLYKEPHYFKIKEHSFKLMHMPYFLTPDTDIVIFGHTHHFEHSYNGEALFINPGEVCAREKPLSECALLEITSHHYIIHHYSRHPEESAWQEERFEHAII